MKPFKKCPDGIAFQFTPLREGRRQTTSGLRTAETFQFTPLREGRPELLRAQKEHGEFQFTPLREGRLGEGYQGFS